ncbi:MAG: hypothetical protein K6F50_02195 [Kiritimatiellae bacterium]|nr:hypothetical protein [Kiritimatiellia bacterium]
MKISRFAAFFAVIGCVATAFAGTNQNPDVVIISPPAFTNVWETYVAYREKTHPDLSFKIKNTDEIYADFPVSTKSFDNTTWYADYALSIHKYIETVASNGTSTVILGAAPPIMSFETDTNKQIPIRYVRTTASTGANTQPGFPSDMYYACLDRNGGQEVWDYNGDGAYCATGTADCSYEDVTVDTTGVDWEADIVVMRMPLQETIKIDSVSYTAAQMMDGYTNKLARAESDDFAGKYRYMLLSGKTRLSTSYYWMNTSRFFLSEYEFFDGNPNMFSTEKGYNTIDNEIAARRMGEDTITRLRAASELIPVVGPSRTAEEYNAAVASDGEAFVINGHGDYDGLDSEAYYVSGLWTQTSVWKFCFACCPCLTGWIDHSVMGSYTDDTLVRCAAQAGVLAPNGGFLVSFNNTRNGLSDGISRDSQSPMIDHAIVRAVHGDYDGTEYPAGEALLRARRACANMVLSDIERLTLCQVAGFGDPLVKITPQGDTTWTGEATDAFTTSRRILATTAETSAEYNLTGDFAASELRLEGPESGAFTLAGGKFRTMNLVSVTNATSLTWSSEGGAGHDGVEFVGEAGTLNLPGSAKRYFGTNFTNVAAINVPGGNVTLDFSASAADMDINFCSAETDRTVCTNTIRSTLDASAARLASDKTIAVANSTLNIENSGLLCASDGAEPGIAATNAVIVVRNSPRWDSVALARDIELNGSELVLDYNYATLGGSDPWSVKVTGGESSFDITDNALAERTWYADPIYFGGSVEFNVADGATMCLDASRTNTVTVYANLNSSGNLRFRTTQSALTAAKTTAVELCKVSGDAITAPFTNGVSFCDADGNTLSKNGLKTYVSSNALYVGPDSSAGDPDILRVNNVLYTAFADAIAAAGNNGTIEVIDDISASSTDVTIPAGVTLSLGSHTLQLNSLTVNGTLAFSSSTTVTAPLTFGEGAMLSLEAAGIQLTVSGALTVGGAVSVSVASEPSIGLTLLSYTSKSGSGSFAWTESSYSATYELSLGDAALVVANAVKVAEVGGVTYPTLAEALTAAVTSSGTVKLLMSTGASTTDVYVPENVTVDVGDYTLTAGTLSVDGTVNVSSNGTLSCTAVAGATTGEVAYTGKAPDGEWWTDSTWQGTLTLTRYGAINNKSQASVELTKIAKWGNANSRVKFNGVRAYLPSQAIQVLPFGLVLEDLDSAFLGQTEAWYMDNGFSSVNNSVATRASFASLSGTGTFADGNNQVSQIILFGDDSEFAGTISVTGKRIVFAASSDLTADSALMTSLPKDINTLPYTKGSIVVATNGTASIPAGKTWKATTLTSYGTLSLPGEANLTGALTLCDGSSITLGSASAALAATGAMTVGGSVSVDVTAEPTIGQTILSYASTAGDGEFTFSDATYASSFSLEKGETSLVVAEAPAPIVYVAKVGETQYETLAAALAAVGESGTVELIANAGDSETAVAVPADVTLVVSNHTLSASAVTGSGRVEYIGKAPDVVGWSDTAWAGTLAVKDASGSGDFAFASYGNADSKVELDDVTGYTAPAGTIDTELVIGENGVSFAAGTFGNATVWEKISGSGKFSVATQTHIVHDAIDFTGDIANSGAYIGFGTTNRYDSSSASTSQSKLENKIYVESDASVSARPGAVWSTSSQVYVTGPVNLVTSSVVTNGMVIISNPACTGYVPVSLQNDATVTVNGNSSAKYSLKCANVAEMGGVVYYQYGPELLLSITTYPVTDGGDVNASITVDDEWLTTHVGSTDYVAVTNMLNSTGANGARYWESYVAGLNPTNGTIKVISFTYDDATGSYAVEGDWDSSLAPEGCGLTPSAVLQASDDLTFSSVTEIEANEGGSFTVVPEAADAQKFYRLRLKFTAQ